MMTVYILFICAAGLVCLLSFFLWRAQREALRQKTLVDQVLDTQKVVMASHLDEPQLLPVVVDHAMKITRAGGAVIEVVEDEDMIYHHATGTAAKFLGMRLKRAGSFSGLCVTEGRALICSDSETDERVDREACRKVDVRSMIVTPLFHDKKIVAVLKVFSNRADAFGEGEKTTLELIGGILASSLARASAQAQLLIAKEKAEAATRTKSLFLANMSHEIRTPLNGVLGVARLLMETPLNAEQKEFANDIYSAGDSLLKLVNDILDFSKVEAGKLEFESIDFDLTSVMQDLSKTIRLSCENKGLDLRVELDKGLPPYLKGDPGRLRQILLNLLGNAVKFTASGYVKVGVKLAAERTDSVSLRFSVEDSGIGIPEKAIGHLFTEFTQADLSTTRRYGGTGLGLSICKYMVEQMKGKIGVESVPGKGTMFWFTLDLPRGHRDERATDHEQVAVLVLKRPRRVLVAEDNRLNQKIALKSLEALGVAADVANDGREAIEKLRVQNFDIILMDCQMPEIDGFEATSIIRKGGLADKSGIPIIAMTANAMKDDVLRCEAAGMDDYLSKPFSLKQLAAVLQKWFDTLDERERLSG